MYVTLLKEISEIMDAKKTTKLLTLLIIIMLLAVGYAAYKIITLNRDYNSLKSEMSETVTAKDLMEEDLKVLYNEYDSIQTENDSMNVKLQEEQEKIALLLKEIKTVKNYNASEVKKYRAEIETLRGIMKSYVYQIDSLNQLNNQLMAENNEVRQNNQRLKYEIDEVVEHNDALEQTVQKAAIIRAANIRTTGHKSNGKEVRNARRVSQIQTHFTLIENNVAEPGERTVYLRLIRPDGFVLVKNTENMFNYEDMNIPFSESRTVQYEGENLDVVIYYDVEQDLLKGTYQAVLFMEGRIIGTTEFMLK